MASVFNRGTRERPRWYARFKDASGIWRARLTEQLTKTGARRVAQELAALAERERLGIDKVQKELCSVLMTQWSLTLTNRSYRDDIGRLRLHVLPAFGQLRLGELTRPAIMRWLDDERTAARISPATLRHCLNLVSRFFGWAIERGHADANPVRDIPNGRRPVAPRRTYVPWIEDDRVVQQIMGELPDPFRLMFFLGNRCGLAMGEIAGLRISDLDQIRDGFIRVRYSYDKPASRGRPRPAVAPVDVELVLGPWMLSRREKCRAEARRPDEAFLFEHPTGGPFRKETIEAAWERARDRLGLASLAWRDATRKSFAMRNVSKGAPLEDVGAALGHSDPVITSRFVENSVGRRFCPQIQEPMRAPVTGVLKPPSFAAGIRR